MILTTYIHWDDLPNRWDSGGEERPMSGKGTMSLRNFFERPKKKRPKLFSWECWTFWVFFFSLVSRKNSLAVVFRMVNRSPAKCSPILFFASVIVSGQKKGGVLSTFDWWFLIRVTYKTRWKKFTKLFQPSSCLPLFRTVSMQVQLCLNAEAQENLSDKIAVQVVETWGSFKFEKTLSFMDVLDVHE